MKVPCLLLATAANLSAAVVAHYDFNSLSSGQNAGMNSLSPIQTIAAMPGTGSPAMLMTAGGSGGVGLQYSQVVLSDNIDLLGAARQFEVTFDLYLSNIQMRQGETVRSLEEFSILFDIPQAQRLDFGRTGNTGGIWTGTGHNGVLVGSFPFDSVIHFRAAIDLDAGTWSTWLDGINLMDSMPMVALPFIRSLSSVRLNLSDDQVLFGASQAWVDNITLTSIPEPRSGCLLLLALMKRRRRECRNL